MQFKVLYGKGDSKFSNETLNLGKGQARKWESQYQYFEEIVLVLKRVANLQIVLMVLRV